MNKPLSGMIATLLIFPLGAVSAPLVSDKSSEPQAQPAVKQPVPAESAEKTAPQAAEKTASASAPAPEKAYQPINGAFGLQLGEQFTESMVAKLLSKQEHSYSGPGGEKLTGSLLRIEPHKPDKHYQKYSLKTTDKGIIYSIQGDYQYEVAQDDSSPDIGQQDEAEDIKPEGMGKGSNKPANKKQATAMQKTCKSAVKSLGKELADRYGKARGQGWDGLWFTFRQPSDSSIRGLKLYGHQCRTGRYSIIYTDETVRRGVVPGKARVSGKVKKLPAVSGDKKPASESKPEAPAEASLPVAKP